LNAEIYKEQKSKEQRTKIERNTKDIFFNENVLIYYNNGNDKKKSI
jgi:hypothetical protein